MKDNINYYQEKKWTDKSITHEEEKSIKTRTNAQKHKRRQKHNFIQRAIKSLTYHHNKVEKSEKKSVYDDDDEHSYKEELDMYIAASCANLCYNDNNKEAVDYSDDETSEEDFDPVLISPHKTGRIDFSVLITSIPSKTMTMTHEFVVPPVQVPDKYHRQDCKGGVLVAGRYVLFTNYAFKRQMHHIGHLGSLPERAEAQLHSLEQVSAGLYSGRVVEL
ncbi:unnamed protein product [Peronospora belbahrii]|uniref:Uncharacterized protein n=1 Tax=Peronospora belbahrii TaxID=622444 RepID=A0AAU9KNU7_9STRA|nr:unnamed protein product [Peronospora belbahrii]CAH0514177.1 unnamed protein product [Peronospora belbahrii]